MQINAPTTAGDRATNSVASAGNLNLQKELKPDENDLQQYNDNPVQRMADASKQVKQLQAYQVAANNSPQSMNARAIQNMANQYKSPQRPTAPVVQLTKWEFDGNRWKVILQRPSKKSRFPAPREEPRMKGTTYDQYTGQYAAPIEKNLDEISVSKGKMSFYDKRATTAYKYASRKNHQGPHYTAHITKRAIMATVEKTGKNPLDLVGTAAFPRPRRANKMMRNRFSAARGAAWKTMTRKERTKFLKAYIKQWNKSQDKRLPLKLRLDALRKGMELNPSTVNNIGKGKTTAAQIKGKGENRKAAVTDIKRMLISKKINVGAGMKTIDGSGAEPKDALESQASLEQMMRIAAGQKVEIDPGSSEDDSDVDMATGKKKKS